MAQGKGSSGGRRAFGNVRELPSGRYQARFEDERGDQHKAPHTFATKGQAGKWLAAQQTARESGTYVDGRAGAVLVADYLADWLAGRVGHRPSTTSRDVGNVERYLVPAFGHLALGKLEAPAVRKWVAELSAAGLAPATIGKAGQILSAAYDQAVDDRVVPANPCRRVRWPKVEALELDVLEPADIAKLADAIDQRYRAVVLLACWAGLRIGEITALRVGDLDPLRRTVRVERTCTEVDGHLYVNAPKTRAGRRTVPLPASVAAELAELVAGKHRDDLVVEAPHGGYIRRSAWSKRYWSPARQAIGRPALRIHDMRHTAVSLWIAAGADAKRVAVWAGHASVVSVFDRYGHLFPAGDDAVAQALDLLRVDVRTIDAGEVVDLETRRRGER